MQKLIYFLAVTASISLFLFGGPVLDMVGWSYQLPSGSALTKIHPATYLFALGALLGLATFEKRYWSVVTTFWYLPYLFAATFITIRAAMIARGGGNGGELSAAIVNFITPVLMVVCFQLRRADLNRIGVGLRIFFAINSLIALFERATGGRIIPTFLDASPNEHRAAALLGHPLSGALLTGLLIVNLVTVPRRDVPAAVRIGELVLHVLAMFAYGGRTALVFLPFTLAASVIFARNRRGETRITPAQRAAPLALLVAGGAFVMLPIPFVEATLERFNNDNGSADARTAAVNIVTSLDTHPLLWGVDTYQRQLMLNFYHTPFGIEISWIGLTVIYGLIATIGILITLPVFLLGIASRLERSANYMILYFLVVTSGSVGISTKSLIIMDLIVMMIAFCQPAQARITHRPSSGRGSGGGVLGVDPLAFDSPRSVPR